jgi:small subunit ribosomal protein S21
MSGILIRVRNNDMGRAITQLKRKMNDEGVLRDLKKHDFYLTKSQKRRVKHKEAVKRLNKIKRLKEEHGG